MKTGYFRLLFLGVLFLIFQQANGQLVGKMDDRVILSDFPYNITSYGADQKVPQSQVLSIVKNPKNGLIVFSTMDGVAEFDGYDISSYPIPKGKEVDIYKKLFFGKNGTDLYGWAASNTLIQLSDTMRNLGRFDAVFISEDYFITVGAGGDLYFRDERVGGGTHHVINLPYIQFVHPISTGVLVLSDATDSYRYDLALNKLDKILSEPLVDFHKEEDHLYYVTRNGLYEEKNGKIQKNALFEGSNLEINDFQKVDDYLVFSSYKGLFAIGENRLYYFDDIEVLPTRQLTSLLYDKEEYNMYVGTADKGFLKFSPKYFVNYYKKGKKSRGSASSIVAVGDSMVINSGFQSLLSIDLDGNVKDLMGKAVFASLAVYGDTVLAGSWDNGLHVFSLKRRAQIGFVGLGNDNVHAPFRDSRGVYWIGGSVGVYTGRDLGQLIKFKPDIFKSITTTIYEDRKGRIWIGGTYGLVLLDENREVILFLNRTNGLKAREVRSFYEDAEGRMWIGTYGGGLYCYTGSKLEELSTFPNYLLGNDIFTLAPDTFGNLLMTSNNGLRIIQEEALIRFLERKSDFLVPYYLSAQSGIYNPEFNGGFINNYASIKKKHFFFPTIQGIVRYDAVEFKPAPAHLWIKRIDLDGEEVKFPEAIPRSTKYIRVELQNTHLSPHTNIYYQYRLASSSDKGPWSTPQKSTTLTFSHLKPGKYKLEVRAIDASNNPDPPVVSYAFYLEPYFYETNEFYASSFLLFSFLVALVLSLNFQRQQRKARREMEVKNTIIELQLRAIQAQMNPHFIFNVLNRLVELISSAKLVQAERFVIDFSKLLRNILEQSDKDFISIREEIKTLQLYMDIQRARRQERFQYQLIVEPGLDNRLIPTMLIQPFVENAIVHGIDHADYPTEIILKFTTVNDDLHVCIQDNGVGREQAHRINQNKKNESKGIELIQRKIDLLRTKYKIDITLMIHDWSNVPPIGTEVHLVLKQTQE